MGFFAKLHVHHLSRGWGTSLWISEYRYLQASIAAFPPPEAFVEMMQEAGLHDIKATKLTLVPLTSMSELRNAVGFTR